MLKIYKESFRFFRTSFPVLLTLAALIEILIWAFEPKAESTAVGVAVIFLAYYFHRHFLFGEPFALRGNTPAEGAPPLKFGWFLLISLALILVPMAIVLTLILAMWNINNSFLAMLSLIFPIYLLSLSLFGTALPATVARDGTYRLAQGVRATFATMWRLILGPGVVGIVLLIGAIAASHVMDTLGIAADGPVALAFNIMLRALGFLTTIFAVAVLCEMYRRTRPEPHATQGSDPAGHRPA